MTIFRLYYDACKLEKINLKSDAILSFAINQEARVDNTLKILFASNSISEEIGRSLKPVGTRPGKMYGFWKVQKDIVDDFQLFGLIFPQIVHLPII